MFRNIAQRLSRLWARVANLTDLPGNPKHAIRIDLIGLNVVTPVALQKALRTLAKVVNF